MQVKDDGTFVIYDENGRSSDEKDPVGAVLVTSCVLLGFSVYMFIDIGDVPVIDIICYLLGLLIFIGILFAVAFYFRKKTNKKTEAIANIKKYGEVCRGNVVHVLRQENSENRNRPSFRFIVELEEHYLESEKYLITESLREDFGTIPALEKSRYHIPGDGLRTKIKVYYGKGYITFNKQDATELAYLKYYQPRLAMTSLDGDEEFDIFDNYSYSGFLTHNFDGSIVCNVYKYNNRYVVDDYRFIDE